MEFKKIYILGDIHGNYNVISQFFEDKEDCLVIQVGDFGIGFYDEEKEFHRLKKLSKDILKGGNHLIAIAGNHDNRDFFTGDFSKIKRFILDGELSNIQLVEDYTVLNINDENYLFVGGAISIDRKSRILDVSYWKNEIFVLDKEKLSTMKNIDRVICHTCPDFCPPTKFNNLVYSFALTDAHLLDELTEERKQLTELYTILLNNGNKIKSFHYGHFHGNSYFNHNKTDFICVDINNVVEV